MKTYKFQAVFLTINIVLMLIYFVGMVLAPFLGLAQIIINATNLMYKMRVKERIIYFTGVIFYFTIVWCISESYFGIPALKGDNIILVGAILPVILAFYSIYIAKLDNDDAEQQLNSEKDIEEHFIG